MFYKADAEEKQLIGGRWVVRDWNANKKWYYNKAIKKYSKIRQKGHTASLLQG